MPLAVVNGPKISAGESLSDSADCTGGTIVRLTVPQEFTDANLTFQASSDGVFFNDVYDSKQNEVMLPVNANTTVVVDATWTRSFGFVKIRSGTRANPVPQQVDCTFAIAVETVV